MSLAPYNYNMTQESSDYTPLLIGTAFAIASLIFNAQDTDATLDLQEASTQTDDAPSLKKTRVQAEDPLDVQIIAILATSGSPMKARDILLNLDSVTKHEVNSRLYKMLTLKKIKKCDTNKAPLWYV